MYVYWHGGNCIISLMLIKLINSIKALVDMVKLACNTIQQNTTMHKTVDTPELCITILTRNNLNMNWYFNHKL